MALGKPDPRAGVAPPKAAALFERFKRSVLWDEELGFYAYALDGEKKKGADGCIQCRTLPVVRHRASRARLKKVVDRLMAPDMFKPDGVFARFPPIIRRSNPYNYQTGSVWPHDNAIIALGLQILWFSARRRRVIAPRTSALQRAIFPAQTSLPGAVQRRSSAKRPTFPVQYIGANVPQAWAAGSAFHLDTGPLGLSAGCAAQTNSISTRSLPKWLAPIYASMTFTSAQHKLRHPLSWRERRGDRVRGDQGGSQAGRAL